MVIANNEADAGFSSRIAQSEKQISRWWSDGDAVRAVVGGDGITAGRPAPAGQIGILLQRVCARVLPRHHHTAPRK